MPITWKQYEHLRLTSDEREVIEPMLDDEALACVMEHTAGNMMPARASYEESGERLLRLAAERLRRYHEERTAKKEG